VKLKKQHIYTLSNFLRKYLRVNFHGIENLKQTTSANIILPNHSGIMGLDAILLKNFFRTDLEKKLSLFAHRFYFDLSSSIGKFFKEFEFKKANFKNGVQELSNGESLLIFPEAEAGNFKSSFKKYQLQNFHSGFVRLAILTQAKITPCLVIGAEESNYNIGNIHLGKFINKLRIPIPVNLLPLPAKWDIHFLEAIDLSEFNEEDTRKPGLCQKIADEIKDKMQIELDTIIQKRDFIYLKKKKALK